MFMSETLKVPKKRIIFEWKRISNIVIGFLLIYFLFFGFIVNTGSNQQQVDPGIKMLYIYTAFFNTDTFRLSGLVWPQFLSFIFKTPCWVSIFIFFVIGILQSYREDFVVYAIKK